MFLFTGPSHDRARPPVRRFAVTAVLKCETGQYKSWFHGRQRATTQWSRSNHFCPVKGRDLVGVVAVLGEHAVGVGAQFGRRRLDARAAMGEFERSQRHVESPVDPGGRSVMVGDATSAKLRVARGLGEGSHACRWDMPRLKEVFPFVGGS